MLSGRGGTLWDVGRSKSDGRERIEFWIVAMVGPSPFSHAFSFSAIELREVLKRIVNS